MTPIGHLAVGFAAKRSGVNIPVGILLASAWLLDILYFLFAFAGIESLENISKPGTVASPWSHGLFMALIWSAISALLAARIYRSRRAGVVIGLTVFSHWLLDFVFWDNTLLFFAGSPEMGLGLYKALGGSSIFVELGLFAVGIAIYLLGRKPAARPALT